jgi:hypothetical protein
MALVPLFFFCAFVIYAQLNVTLISLLAASRWLALFGVLGFLGLYGLRKLFPIDLTDGLIISIFGLAPLLLATMLTVNYYLSTPFEETHDIVAVDGHGNMLEIRLAENAYHDFYRIRCFSSDNMKRTGQITYHFGKGALGWQVMTGNNWEE